MSRSRRRKYQNEYGRRELDRMEKIERKRDGAWTRMKQKTKIKMVRGDKRRDEWKWKDNGIQNELERKRIGKSRTRE